jgi:iron complex outermembrane recepter protein
VQTNSVGSVATCIRKCQGLSVATVVLCTIWGNQNSARAQQSNGISESLSEVIVTAQKRDERLQDVPVPLSVINSDSLVSNSQVLLRDYYMSVPGLNLSPDEEGNQNVSIRGVTMGGFEIPTVAILIDDVPFGAASGGDGHDIPDIDPGDLQHIEVLRGPQGTLYGANAMGGIIKYVTIQPAMDGYHGSLEAGVSGVHNGDEAGYNVRAALNAPLSDTAAVRVSGYTRQDPGYVDNVFTGRDGVNEVEARGGRFDGLWHPADEFSIKLSAIYQTTQIDGVSDVDQLPGLGDLQQSYISGTGPSHRTFLAYSAIVKAKLAGIDMVSITGYEDMHYQDVWDWSSGLSGVAQSGIPGTSFNGFGVTGVPFHDHVHDSKVTQESRFSGSLLGDRLDWLLGGFYAHDNTRDIQDVYASVPETGAVVGQLADVPTLQGYKEYAAFADLTYHVSDRIDVQLGGRESWITVSQFPANESGPLFGAVPVPQPTGDSHNNAATYLLTSKYKVSQDVMPYIRLASGYRPGGPNGGAVAFGAPAAYSPDKTQSYEAGLKADFLDHMISVDTSIYYVNWQHIQVGFSTPSHFGYTGNAGDAKSEGVEFSVTSHPLTGLSLSSWISYDDAVLTQDFPAAVLLAGNYGVAGDRLPNTPRLSANLSAEQDFPITAKVSGFLGGSFGYVGDRLSVFEPQGIARQIYPSYTKTDLRAGVRYGSWTVNAFANNVADRRAILGGGEENLNPYAFYYLQPRLIGLSVKKTF